MRTGLAALLLSTGFLVLRSHATVADTAIFHSDVGPIFSAQMLVLSCSQSDTQIQCDPYIAGVLDSITSNRGYFESNYICMPKDIDIATVRRLSLEFIRAHKELPESAIAASVIVTAITEAYPCPDNSKPQQ